MAFDAFVLKAIAGEIEERLIKTAARISRVYQINSTDILLYFKGETQKEPLFLSIHAKKGRINFSSRHYSHPASPPTFCMLLRKHLANGLLTSLEQPPLERVLYLHFAVVNESGREVEKTLVAEIMGRHSNLILLNSPDEDGRQVILGVLKPVPSSVNRFRTLLPHNIYFPPPPQEKLHPYALSYGHFQQEIAANQGQPTSKFLLDHLQGLSPFLAKEIAARAGSSLLSADSSPLLWQKLEEILKIYEQKKWKPLILQNLDRKPLDYTVIHPVQSTWPFYQQFSSISRLLDEFYEYRERVEAKEDLYAFLYRHIAQAIKKVTRKKEIQVMELEKSQKANYYRQCGELILMNLKKIPPKAGEIYLENIFQENREKIKIELDPQLSPAMNAQRFFRKYRKARQGEKKIAVNLQQTRYELAYLENVLFTLESADLETLGEIRDELMETGYLPAEKKPSYPRKTFSYRPQKYISSQGEEIYVGRNNRQNEYLLHHFAAKTDLWFHAKDIPGAHVIVRSTSPHETTIKEAALLAAHFSRGAHSSNVPVDYTAVKNIRRIPGGKPGLVTYSNQKTVYVTPEEGCLRPLLKQRL